MNTTATPSTTAPQRYARLAGVLYLLITVAAVFAHFILPDTFIVAGDAAATAANIADAPQQFLGYGLGGELVVLLSETILSVLLYVLLKPVNVTLSLLAAIARLVMTAVHGVNLVAYGLVAWLVSGNTTAFEPAQIDALVMMTLDAHNLVFTVGIAFLVIHVIGLGILITRSGYFPRLIGVLFLLAGVGYTFDTIAHLFVPSYTETLGLIAMIIAAAELAFPLWLLIRGVDKNRWPRA